MFQNEALLYCYWSRQHMFLHPLWRLWTRYCLRTHLPHNYSSVTFCSCDSTYRAPGFAHPTGRAAAWRRLLDAAHFSTRDRRAFATACSWLTAMGVFSVCPEKPSCAFWNCDPGSVLRWVSVGWLGFECRWYWGLDPGSCTCWAGIPEIPEPHSQLRLFSF